MKKKGECIYNGPRCDYINGMEIRGLRWFLDIFGSGHSVLAWAFKHQAHSVYPDPPAFRELVTPNFEIPEKVDPHPLLAGFDHDDYRVESGKVLTQAREITGIGWPILELAFSYNNNARLLAIESLASAFSYPPAYTGAVCYAWRRTKRIKPSILVHLSGVSARSERRWRENIHETLSASLDDEIDRIEREY